MTLPNTSVREHLSLTCRLSNTGASGIAKGAIMRAQDKQLGPERIPTQSIGIYRHIHWEDGLIAPYMNQRVERDGSDYLIKNTIQWIVKRVRIFLRQTQHLHALTHRLREMILSPAYIEFNSSPNTHSGSIQRPGKGKRSSSCPTVVRKTFGSVDIDTTKVSEPGDSISGLQLTSSF